jgi:NAD(P)-dependent dehydrogenase (short-subunit alcohol dehydrogenase family)
VSPSATPPGQAGDQNDRESVAGEQAADGSGPVRTVLVTGGSRGIGYDIAAQFAAAGHRVAATHRRGDVPTGVLGVECDITDPAQVEAAFAQVEASLGSVDVLVANAGINRDTLMLRMTDDDWDAVIQANLTGSFRVAKRAMRTMIRRRFGRIVFISSVVAQLGSPGQVNYAASKAGLVGMARSLAREVGSRGVTVNVVAPGFIETAMTAELDTDRVAGYRQQIPLGRLGQTSDVAAAVRFLASEGGGYITGAQIPVDGGLGMGH